MTDYQIGGFSKIDRLYRRLDMNAQRRRHRQSDLQSFAAFGIAGGAHVGAGVALLDVLDDQGAVTHHVMARRLLDRFLPLIPVVVPSMRENRNRNIPRSYSVYFNSIPFPRVVITERPTSESAPNGEGGTLAETLHSHTSRLTRVCARSQQNAYANYHFPRSSKRRCYYCS